MKKPREVQKMITKEQYIEAIDNLKLAMTQLVPDGDCCHVCGDNGHQAWECHHNPLSVAYSILGQGGYWKCFHCNEVFTDFNQAKEHFGQRESTRPICEALCSGYGVFPDGRRCKGCADCETDNQR